MTLVAIVELSILLTENQSLRLLTRSFPFLPMPKLSFRQSSPLSPLFYDGQFSSVFKHATISPYLKKNIIRRPFPHQLLHRFSSSLCSMSLKGWPILSASDSFFLLNVLPQASIPFDDNVLVKVIMALKPIDSFRSSSYLT